MVISAIDSNMIITPIYFLLLFLSLRCCFHILQYYLCSFHNISKMITENRDYDALVQNINIGDITSSAQNADVLRRLRNTDPYWNQELYILESEIDGDIDEFVVGAGDDLGWLGYFIGRSEVLKALHIYVFPEEKEQLVAFMRGIIQNKSIKELSIHTDLGDQGFESIGYFLRNHNALTHLRFNDFHVDTDCVQNIAMALEQCRHNSLRSF